VRADVVFATMTLARTATESDLLVRALESLARFNRPIMVADGGSSPAFVHRISALAPTIEVLGSRFGGGLVGQIRTALDAALGTGHPIICYTEPDKLDFFGHGVEPFIDSVRPDASFGAVVAGRTAAAFDTFPQLQQYTERAINDLVAEVVGIPGDYSYGPFAMAPELAQRVVELSEDVGWGWRHYAFATARRLGRSVALHRGDFACPADQRSEDATERWHRVRQLEQNSRGLLLARRDRPDGETAGG
jgi:hypothetical protein